MDMLYWIKKCNRVCGNEFNTNMTKMYINLHISHCIIFNLGIQKCGLNIPITLGITL